MEDLVADLNPTVIHRRYPGQVEVPVRTLPSSPMQKELRRLVGKWMTSGPNLKKLFISDPDLERRTREGRTILYPATDGRGYLDWFPHTDEADLSSEKSDYTSPEDKALRHFMGLITNPEWRSLAGPCARCNNYFLNHAKRKRTYCSRSCGAATTAAAAVKKFREREQAAKIEKAQKALSEWKKGNRKIDWKRFLAQDPELSLKWITRAVNRGQLQSPKSKPSNNG